VALIVQEKSHTATSYSAATAYFCSKDLSLQPTTENNRNSFRCHQSSVLSKRSSSTQLI